MIYSIHSIKRSPFISAALFSHKKITYISTLPTTSNTYSDMEENTKPATVSVQKVSESVNTLATCMFKQLPVASQTVP